MSDTDRDRHGHHLGEVCHPQCAGHPINTPEPFYEDAVTGMVCDRHGDILCCNTDLNHRHRAIKQRVYAPRREGRAMPEAEMDALRERLVTLCEQAERRSPGEYRGFVSSTLIRMVLAGEHQSEPFDLRLCVHGSLRSNCDRQPCVPADRAISPDSAQPACEHGAVTGDAEAGEIAQEQASMVEWVTDYNFDAPVDKSKFLDGHIGNCPGCSNVRWHAKKCPWLARQRISTPPDSAQPA